MNSLLPGLIERFRAEMPVCREWNYFDHAAVAPLSAPAAQAIKGWLEQATNTGDVHWLEWSRRSEELRKLAARLVNAVPDEIALVPNTTVGIGLVAEGYPWQVGDNVVIAANEFPSNQYPWLNLATRGVDVRRVEPRDGKIEVDDVRALCDERTRVVALSWVGFASGWRIDVANFGQYCREQGIFFFLDAIQGLGVFPLDVVAAGVDAFAADGHKWMLGPEGAGLLYVRQEWLNRLRPLMVGWNSVAQREFNTVAWQPRASAARYEGGSANLGGLLGLAASLEMLAEFGLSSTASPIAERVVQLTAYATERLLAAGARILSPRVPGHESGILTFQFRDEPADFLRQRLLAKKVVTSARGGGVRIAPHGYNTPEEIDQLVGALV